MATGNQNGVDPTNIGASRVIVAKPIINIETDASPSLRIGKLKNFFSTIEIEAVAIKNNKIPLKKSVFP